MIAVALLALALYVPGTLYPPSDVAHTVFRVAVCLGIATRFGLPRGKLVRWGIGLWLAGIVWSAVAAPDPWRAWWSTHNRQEGAWQAAHYLGLVLVACAVSRERLVRWLAVAAGLAVLPAFLPLGWNGGRLAGSAGNPLYLAPLLLMGVWASWRAGSRVLAAALALAALATGSTAVLLAAVAAGGVLVSARWPRVFWGACAVVAVGLWFVPIPDSGLIRLELARVGLRGVVAQPLGWGAEGFSYVWDTFWRGASATGEAWHDRAHSLVIDRALEWGLVGVAGWALVVAAAWRRAELPERAAIAAYLAFSLTMFEMMWGAAGFAVVLGYVLRRHRWHRLPTLGYGWAAVALVVGAAQLAASGAIHRAATAPAMEAALERWSPVGGDGVELLLQVQPDAETLAWAADHTETLSPHATQQAFLLAVWDRAYCVDLRLAAPKRPDVRQLCNTH